MMINWKLISKVMGMLIFIEAGLMFICQIVSWIYDEGIQAFLLPILIAAVTGGIGVYTGRNAKKDMGRRDGYIIVSMIWVLFSIIGMLPFLFCRCVPDMASAFFETMSGFTSTGATNIDDLDAMPHGILFWRSLTQWIGGIGIVFFTIAILPAFGVSEVKLFAAESTGPIHNKVHPRISVAAKWIGSVYIMLTTLCFGTLMLCGMGLFDAVNYALCTTATGGYGTHSDMLDDYYNSPAIDYTLIFFMFASGVNYALIYYTILKGQVKKFFADIELRTYLAIVVGVSAICAVTLFFDDTNRSIEYCLRHSLFTVVSLQTTTGLATVDFALWPTQLMPLLLFVMFAGACSGSTSGGFKCIRLTMIYKVIKNEFTRVLHPRAVIPVRINGNIMPSSIVPTLLGFSVLYIVSLFIGTFVLALSGVSHYEGHTCIDYYEAFGLALTSISNVGPGMGYYGPAHSWAILSPVAKYVCSFLMLIGRLEILPIMLLFTRGFWQRQ